MKNCFLSLNGEPGPGLDGIGTGTRPGLGPIHGRRRVETARH